MVISNQSAIIREKRLDDGTTLGKKVYQTADGRWWEEVFSPSELTGVINGILKNGIIQW